MEQEHAFSVSAHICVGHKAQVVNLVGDMSYNLCCDEEE